MSSVRLDRQGRGGLVAIAALALATVVLAGCASAKPSGGSTAAANATSASTASSTGAGSANVAGSGATACSYTPTGQAAKNVGTPPAKGVAPGAYTATLSTNRGVITFSLNAAKAPCTVNSFAYLASKNYFNGSPCHRLTTSGIFVLQCGDPTGTGGGGPGYQFGDENLAGATYPAGTVAMANAGPGTNGSQFFLVYQDTQLGPNYTPFGTISGGLDVLKKIAAGGEDDANGPGDGHPKLSVTLTNVAVSKSS